MRGHKITIQYIGISSLDWITSETLEDVQGFNLLTKEGVNGFVNKIEKTTGVKVSNLQYNKEPQKLIDMGVFGLSVFAEAYLGKRQ